MFKHVLSLLALIFAYDAIAGERERGTLRLVLTHPIRRWHFLLAKYISLNRDFNTATTDLLLLVLFLVVLISGVHLAFVPAAV